MLNPTNKASAQLSPPLGKNGRPKTSRKTDLPSYIPSRTFTSALLGIGQTAVKLTEGADLRQEMRKIDQSIAEIPSEPVREALIALLHNAQGDAVAFRRNVEQWYDDQMERVSGWYRKRIQKVLWILAFAGRVRAQRRRPADGEAALGRAERARVARQPGGDRHHSAGGRTRTRREALETLTVPLGWHFESARDDPQGFPIYQDPEMIWALLSKLIGLTLTAVAISFGAPFWFDTLSKLARLRSGGAPPPASDASEPVRASRREPVRAPFSPQRSSRREARRRRPVGGAAATAAPSAGSETQPSVEAGPPARGKWRHESVSGARESGQR